MIDTTRKPTSYDLEKKARLLARLAHTAALQANEVCYDSNQKETIDALAEFCELLDDAAKELYILCSVHSDFSKFTDFDECKAIFGADAKESETGKKKAC